MTKPVVLALALALTPQELRVNCLNAIRLIREDVGEKSLACEIAKSVEMKFKGHAIEKVDCSKVCKERLGENE